MTDENREKARTIVKAVREELEGQNYLPGNTLASYAIIENHILDLIEDYEFLLDKDRVLKELELSAEWIQRELVKIGRDIERDQREVEEIKTTVDYSDRIRLASVLPFIEIILKVGERSSEEVRRMDRSDRIIYQSCYGPIEKWIETEREILEKESKLLDSDLEDEKWKEEFLRKHGENWGRKDG